MTGKLDHAARSNVVGGGGVRWPSGLERLAQQIRGKSCILW